MFREKSPEEKAWDVVSGQSHDKIAEIQKTIKGYSYKRKDISLATDENICRHFVDSLSQSKKLLFSISDTCFSLHVGNNILPLTDIMRDEVDILSDEIKVRHCEWQDIPPDFLNKVISHDLKMLTGLQKINKNLDIVFVAIIEQAKKNKGDSKFWKKVRIGLLKIRGQVRELVILFKERETLCNINPITLERTFQSIRREIRGKV